MMGYTLTIGNAELVFDPEGLYLKIGAKGTSHDDAPDHDCFVGKQSSQSPSYTTWHEFCRDAGIETLFYGGGWDRSIPGYRPCPEGYHRETPLLQNRPGVQPLCKGDLEVVRSARERREKANGGRKPGFYDLEFGKLIEIQNDKDSTLARLLWLEFWIDWALKNCAIPVIENTLDAGLISNPLRMEAELWSLNKSLSR